MPDDFLFLNERAAAACCSATNASFAPSAVFVQPLTMLIKDSSFLSAALKEKELGPASGIFPFFFSSACALFSPWDSPCLPAPVDCLWRLRVSLSLGHLPSSRVVPAGHFWGILAFSSSFLLDGRIAPLTTGILSA